MTDKTSPLTLKLENVSKQYAAGNETLHVLRDISLEVPPGQSLAIVGPSGSGKSTLLNIIGGLDRPTSGRVTLDGQNIADLADTALARMRSRNMGFIFQLHHLLPQCTVRENVLVPTLAADGATPEVQNRASVLLDRVGLGDRQNHRPGQLSGGECQRVAVARALINQPRLLLADEPTGQLDHASAEKLADLLAELNRRQNVTLIVVTHSPELARRMDRTLELKDGLLTDK